MKHEHMASPRRVAGGKIADIIDERHKRASRALGYALTVGLPSHWTRTAVIWEAYLNPDERASLARSVLMAMPPEDIADLATDMLDGAGFPLPPFINSLGDAREWAQGASPDELRAYCLASFNAMSPKDRKDFLEFAGAAA